MARWFLEEIYPHDGELRAYLQGHFPEHPDLDDLVQDTYVRLLSARQRGELRSPRSFLFATARNAAIDFFRRRSIVPFQTLEDPGLAPVPDGGPDASDSLCRKQELLLLAEGIDTLPKRCREIFRLRKLEGLSHAQIAASLGISEHTVNAQIAVGILRLRAFLQERGVKGGGA